MKIQKLLFIALTFFLVGFSACKKDDVSNKIVDSLPIRTDEVIIPAYSVQEFGLLKKASLTVIITTLNQISLAVNPNLTLVTDNCPNYDFDVSEAHFGSAHYVINFKNISNVVVCASSVSIPASVTVTGSGASSLFTYTDSMEITMTIPGNINADILATGMTAFTGIGSAAGYSITFDVPAPGARVNAEGLRGGVYTASGTGPPANGALQIDMTLHSNNDHTIDGSMIWEGQNGGIHMDNIGVGFVVTNNSRVTFN